MLEINGIETSDLVFSGWGIPEAIDVYYYKDPETKNRTSSGFSVIYSNDKEILMTDEWMKELKELKLDSVILFDKNDILGTLETIYHGLYNSGIEKNEDYIRFDFTSDSSNTFLKIKFE